MPREFLLEFEMIQNKVLKEIKIRFMFNIFFSPKIVYFMR